MNKQINHDKYHDESKSRTHRLSKLPDDGDPCAPNNLLTPEQIEPRWAMCILAAHLISPAEIKVKLNFIMI